MSADSSSRPVSMWSRHLRATAWVLVYLCLAAFPLVVLLLGPVPRGGGFAWDFAMGLGFAGLALMGLQFVLTARFRRATWPFGIDIIYYFHRWAAISGLALLVGHYGILRLHYGATIGPVSPWQAPAHMTAGRIALLFFALLVATSLWRRKLRFEYDLWRVSHGALATLAVILAIAHIAGVGHYTRYPWKGGVWIGYSVLWLGVLGYVRVVRPLRLLRQRYRVREVRAERGRSWTVTLEPETPAALPFQPGQFAWLSLGTNPFRAKEHPFSFSGSAADPRKLSFTIKELGDFTSHVGETKVGAVAYVDGPHGVFSVDFHPRAAGFVFVAGGIGIAPIMSMLRTLADRGDGRPLHLIYGNWRWDGVTFREEIAALEQRLRLSVTHVLQEPPSDWSGERGFISEGLLRRALPADSRHCEFFLCGPKAMTDFVLPSLRRLRVPLHRIHFEHFEMV